MLVIAHRGLHHTHRENSLEAFQAAIERGADGIETDVRLSADGVAVLHHDPHTPKGRELAALTHRELCTELGYHVPTLEDALQLMTPESFLWNLEIKVPAASDVTIAAVQRVGRPRQYLVSSFWHPLLVVTSRQAGLQSAALVCHHPLHARAWATELAKAGIGAVVWHYETLDHALLAECKAVGLDSYVYGPESIAEHQSVAALKPAGVITDHPQYLLDSREQKGCLK